MQFICGVVDKEGHRRILSAESTPTLENIGDLTAKAPIQSYDWGSESSVEASEWTARVILSSVTNLDEALRLAPLYAEEVVRSLGTERMWILPSEEVEGWLTKNRLLV